MDELVRENTFEIETDMSFQDFLVLNCPFFSSDEYASLFVNKRFSLNGYFVESIDVSLKLGDVVTLRTPRLLEPEVDVGYELIYEDDFFFVINKPANLPVHPAGKYYFNTLTYVLSLDGFVSSFPVNRLDRETSGLVLFAKTKEFAAVLQNMFLSGSVKKVYEVVVFGKTKSEFTVEAPLRKTVFGEIRDHMLVDSSGLACKTSFKLLRDLGDFSFLKAILYTGRRHQIRAHLSYIGHPVVGDKQYGFHPDVFVEFVKHPSLISDDYCVDLLGASRQLLHCKLLCFTHPKTKEMVCFEAKTPKDISNLVKKD